ncbi:hypothetical protein NLD39_004521 [Salmonella enterica]|nr:hypothetical protein [Salmonella enterica]
MVLIFGGIHSTINICVLMMDKVDIHVVDKIERVQRSFQVVKVKQPMTRGQLMAMALAKKLMTVIVSMNVLKIG